MLRKLMLCCASIATASVASGLFVLVIDPVTSAGAHGANLPPISVNRALKGDRLNSDVLPMHIATRPDSRAADNARHEKATPAKPVSAKAPLGCDPSFSPVASPALANIFGRCTT